LTESIKNLEGMLGMTLETALERNTDTDKTNDVNLPGFGFLASTLDDRIVSQKARDFRQAAQNIFNPEISAQFGASQTVGEVGRFQKASGSGKFEKELTSLKGLLGIKKAVQADLEAISAGYKPETIQTYQSRKGVNLQSTPELDPRVENFMKKNNITDKDEAIRILKENKKL
jgi:hypothetical protein